MFVCAVLSNQSTDCIRSPGYAGGPERRSCLWRCKLAFLGLSVFVLFCTFQEVKSVSDIQAEIAAAAAAEQASDSENGKV